MRYSYYRQEEKQIEERYQGDDLLVFTAHLFAVGVSSAQAPTECIILHPNTCLVDLEQFTNQFPKVNAAFSHEIKGKLATVPAQKY